MPSRETVVYLPVPISRRRDYFIKPNIGFTEARRLVSDIAQPGDEKVERDGDERPLSFE